MTEAAALFDWHGLRIALVGPLPPPAGGMALQTIQLAELLRSEGAKVNIVQTNSPHWPKWAGYIPILRAACRLLPYLYRLWVEAGRSDLLHLMANSGWSWHLFAAPAIWIAHWRGKPIVVNYRGGGAAGFLGSQSRLVIATLNRAKAIIVPSAFLQQVFKSHGIATDVVPNVVNLSRFSPTERHGTRSHTAPHLIVTRNLESIYNNEGAIRAFALLRHTYPQARLTLTGTGPELGRLQQLAKDIGLADAVHFAGRLDSSQIADLYRSAQLMWNPSLVDNMPNSVLEAMASGVPVVSTNVGGVPFMLSHGRTGLLVEPDDPRALADGAVEVLKDSALRERLIDNGIVDVQRYAWMQVKPLFAKTYSAAMASR
jgi:glycosyltransferase involved in cell wall biosynthesis